jgi:hypothetical protein
MAPHRHQLEVYDGTLSRGSILIRGREYRAIDARGNLLGVFPNQRDAARAVILATLDSAS